MRDYKTCSNKIWTIPTDYNGYITDNGVLFVLLMDIRNELYKLNSIIQCHNTISIPNILRQIKSNTGRIPVQKKSKRTQRKG